MIPTFNQEGRMREAVRTILLAIGEEPFRAGLVDTPDRVRRSWLELYGGYAQDPADVFKVFEERYDQMVLVKDVDFYSMCEHHMLPFFGKAHIAYLPAGKVIGLSKIPRLLDVYARRLQVQERLTQQVTAALDTYLKPLGSACVVEAQHFCLVCRGAMKHNAKMVTSSLTGEFLKPEVRAEFFSLTGVGR